MDTFRGNGRMVTGITAALFLSALMPSLVAGTAAEDDRHAQISPPKTTHSARPQDDSKAKQTLDERLLFYSSKYPQGNWQPDGLTFEDAWFSAEDGTRIHGWLCPCKNPRAFLLYIHGNAGNITSVSGLLSKFQRELRTTVLAFDYRGFGRSEGTPTVEGMLQDARAARAFLAKYGGIKESDVVLMGRSLGGAPAARLAGESRPRGLILESTFTSLKEIATRNYGQIAWLVPASRLNSVEQVARCEGPLLVIHGDADDTVPCSMGRELYQAAKGPKKELLVLPGINHNDPPPPVYYQRLDRFLDSLPP